MLELELAPAGLNAGLEALGDREAGAAEEVLGQVVPGFDQGLLERLLHFTFFGVAVFGRPERGRSLVVPSSSQRAICR